MLVFWHLWLLSIQYNISIHLAFPDTNLLIKVCMCIETPLFNTLLVELYYQWKGHTEVRCSGKLEHIHKLNIFQILPKERHIENQYNPLPEISKCTDKLMLNRLAAHKVISDFI